MSFFLSHRSGLPSAAPSLLSGSRGACARRGRVAMFAVLAGLATARTGFAGPGDHIRAGDLEIAPTLDLGMLYQTNVYRSELLATPAANLMLTPGLEMSASGDDHEFSASGEWRLQKYLYVAEIESSPITSSERIASLDRFDNFQAGLGAELFKRNPVGLRFSDQLTRSNWQVDASSALVPYTSQLRNALKSGIRLNPGPALEVVPGFTWTYDAFQRPFFSEADADQERTLNQRNTLGGALDTKWAFFPRTALVANFSLDRNQWAQNTINAETGGDLGGQVDVPDSTFVRFSGGIDGRFTEKLFLQAILGYGVGSFNPESVELPEDPASLTQGVSGLDGLLVRTQLKYHLTPPSQRGPGNLFTLGYVKDFRSSFFTNYVAASQVFADFHGQIASLEPRLRYEVQFQEYAGEVDRQDIVNRVEGGLNWRPSGFANLYAGVDWTQRASSDSAVEFDNVGFQFMSRFAY